VLLEAGAELPPGRGVHLWLTRPAGAAKDIRMPPEPARYAAVLYETLHGLDAEGWDWIAVEPPPDTPQWAAIADRLWRAAS
jgi:L-threonylcarbamoyladenylate synthase